MLQTVSSEEFIETETTFDGMFMRVISYIFNRTIVFKIPKEPNSATQSHVSFELPNPTII